MPICEEILQYTSFTSHRYVCTECEECLRPLSYSSAIRKDILGTVRLEEARKHKATWQELAKQLATESREAHRSIKENFVRKSRSTANQKTPLDITDQRRKAVRKRIKPVAKHS